MKPHFGYPVVCAKMWHVHFLSGRTLGLAPSLAAPWTRKSISIGKKVLSQSTWQQSFSSRSKVTLMLSSLQTRTYLFLRFLLTSDLINVSKLLIFEVSSLFFLSSFNSLLRHTVENVTKST